jgi:hypothetical protein
MAVIGDRNHIFEVSKVHGPKIGAANRLSRDNRLDLSRIQAYRSAKGLAMTRNRHMPRLWSPFTILDLPRRETPNIHRRKA